MERQFEREMRNNHIERVDTRKRYGKICNHTNINKLKFTSKKKERKRNINN